MGSNVFLKNTILIYNFLYLLSVGYFLNDGALLAAGVDLYNRHTSGFYILATVLTFVIALLIVFNSFFGYIALKRYNKLLIRIVRSRSKLGSFRLTCF